MSDLPSELTDRTAVLLRAALTRAEAMGEQALAPLAIHGREFAVLALLLHGDPARSQRHLGSVLGLDRTTTMKLVVGLESRGLVRRDPDPGDRRSYRLALTTAGRRLAVEAGQLLAACDDAVTDGRLSPEEVGHLHDLLRRLR